MPRKGTGKYGASNTISSKKTQKTGGDGTNSPFSRYRSCVRSVWGKGESATESEALSFLFPSLPPFPYQRWKALSLHSSFLLFLPCGEAVRS